MGTTTRTRSASSTSGTHSIIYKHLGDGEGEPDVSFEAKITFEELERINKKYGAIEGTKQHIGNFAKYLETLKHA